MASSLKTLKARSYKRAFFSVCDGQDSGLSNGLLAGCPCAFEDFINQTTAVDCEEHRSCAYM